MVNQNDADAKRLAELVSAMPTAGGIYYWSFKLGKPIHAWITGWLNLVGLVAVTAGVDYGFAIFFTTTANLYSKSFDPTNLKQVFVVFLVTVIIHIIMNVYGAKVIHYLQNINVYWHVFGVAAIVAILALMHPPTFLKKLAALTRRLLKAFGRQLHTPQWLVGFCFWHSSLQQHMKQASPKQTASHR